MSVVTLAEVKSDLGLTTVIAARDATLQAVIDAAEISLAHHVGYFPAVIRTDYVLATNGTLILPHTPASNVQSVADNAGTAVDVTTLRVDARTGIVTFKAYAGGVDTLGTLYGTYAVTYTAGWAVIPADLRQAVKAMVRHLWRPQRAGDGDQPVQVLRTGALAQTPSALPLDVQMLIERFTDDEQGFA